MATPSDLPDSTESRVPGAELSNDTKQRIVGRFAAGQSQAQIAIEESLLPRTVSQTIRKTITRGTTQNNPRSGRPRLYDARTARLIVRIARKHPKWTYKQLQQETGLDLSRDTLRTILRDSGIINWRCKKRPHLTEVHVQLRLRWALANRNTDWSRWLFSDECSVEKGAGQ